MFFFCCFLNAVYSKGKINLLCRSFTFFSSDFNCNSLQISNILFFLRTTASSARIFTYFCIYSCCCSKLDLSERRKLIKPKKQYTQELKSAAHHIFLFFLRNYSSQIIRIPIEFRRRRRKKFNKKKTCTHIVRLILRVIMRLLLFLLFTNFF